jgi:3-isopropylmalate dehydrogenase
MTYKISLITGDGIGPELSESVISILDTIHDNMDLKFDITKLQAGDAALKDTGKALPDDTFNTIKNSDVCLKAPVGESAADVIVYLRRMLDLYANIRPAKSYPYMDALRDDIDLVIVRENTEDLYTGKEIDLGNDIAVALRIITKRASTRIAKHAFETAKMRDNDKKLVTCVHKSNVLRVTDSIFANACIKVAQDYPDVSFEQMYVDACAMNLIRRPQKFDVIVTTNLFGDILSDESSQVVGGLGMAPAANIGDDFALFEPVHGAAFDIAGKHIANPSSFILSVKMMLDWLGKKHDDKQCFEIGQKLESSVFDVIKNGIKTMDIGGDKTTIQFTKEIISRLNC